MAPALQLDRYSPALVVLCPQRRFVHNCGTHEILQGIAELVDQCIARGVPVFIVSHVEQPGDAVAKRWQEGAHACMYSLAAEDKDAQIVEPLRSTINSVQGHFRPEMILRKSGYSAFTGTQLHAHLQDLRVGHLLVCGYLVDFDVEQTARDAVDRGLRATVVGDCCGYLDVQDLEDGLERIGCLTGVMSAENVKAAVQAYRGSRRLRAAMNSHTASLISLKEAGQMGMQDQEKRLQHVEKVQEEVVVAVAKKQRWMEQKLKNSQRRYHTAALREALRQECLLSAQSRRTHAHTAKLQRAEDAERQAAAMTDEVEHHCMQEALRSQDRQDALDRALLQLGPRKKALDVKKRLVEREAREKEAAFWAKHAEWMEGAPPLRD